MNLMYAPLVVGLLLFVAGQPIPKTGQCPSNYRDSGHWCTPISPNAPLAVPKGAGQCPSGYVNSGGACLQINDPHSWGPGK